MDQILSFDGVPKGSFSRVWIDTRQVKQGIEELDSLLRKSRTQNTAFATCLIGPARCGKTSLIKRYLRLCQRGEGGRRPLTFLWVELGDNTRSRNIATLTLTALQDPNPSKGDATHRRQRVVDAIHRRGYDLIVYDEAHHLVDSKTHSVQDDGVAFINGLLNTGRCPIVLVGYDTQVNAAIHRNPSLAGRLWPFPPFKPYNYKDLSDLREFQGILQRFEEFMKLPTPSYLYHESTAARVCYTCCGRLGLLEIFLEYAREISQRRQHSCLTLDDLHQAAKAVGPTNIQNWSFNPFAVEDLDAAVKAEKDRIGTEPNPRKRRQ